MLEHLQRGRRRVTVEVDRRRLRRSSSRPRSPSDVVRSLPAEPSVLFLCMGNICRSPMAERYCRERLTNADCDPVVVESAGFVRKQGRSSPDTAVEAAIDYDVDLSDHRSRTVSADLLSAIDLVLLMDAWNYRYLKNRHERALPKATFLKPFAERATDETQGRDSSNRDFEIEDPYGEEVAAFRTVYDEVVSAVDGLVAELERR